MLTNEELKACLEKQAEIDWVKVEGDGYHYVLEVVSDVFKDKSVVARQRWVYGILKNYITSGSLHAITMQTWTKAEWESQDG